MADEILVEREGAVSVLLFNRPQKKNALTGAMYNDASAALLAAEKDPSVRAVLVTASGADFTAGNDLADFLEAPPSGDDAPVFRFLTALTTLTKPLVAAVDGAAVGVGVTMLLHCDLVVTTERARLVTPFVGLGLVPEAASSLLLPRLVGHVRAAELLLLGEPIDGRTALAWGLVNRVVAPEALRETALGFCQKLAAKPPQSLRLSRALMREPGHQTVEARLRHEAVLFMERLTSPEAKEAFQAFLEKRPPKFS